MAKFYFTYGNDPEYPFQGGWTVIEARNLKIATGVFKALHPLKDNRHDRVFEVLNCAEFYTEERFNKTKMPINGNRGAFCHEEYSLIKRHRRRKNVCKA